MNMEQLSKSQIVLLTLLVSFVTSIATGIVTVSLMDQAPPAITQTVNRIIERTVEKVTPAAQTASTIVTQEKTIIVKESDMVSQAVTRVSPSVVRLYSSDDNPLFLGLGIVVDASGVIVSDTESAAGLYSVVAELTNGSRVRAFVTSRDAASAVAYFESATTTLDGKPIVWNPVVISGTRPNLGALVVMLAGRATTRIGSGLVTAFLASGGQDTPQVIDTDIPSAQILAGSPLITTDGTLIGMSTNASRAVSASGFISSSVLMKKPESSEKDKGAKASGN